MKKSILNLKTMALSLLLILAIVIGLINIDTSTVSAATNVGFGGYYETSLSENVITVDGISGKTVSSVKVDGTTLSTSDYSVSGSDVTLKKSNDIGNVLNTRTLGNDCALTVLTNSGDYTATFRYVTKAIRKASDLAVFNTTHAQMETSQKITGYYVLANNISYDENFINTHRASLDYTDDYQGNFGFAGTFDGQGYYMSYKPSTHGIFGGLTGATVKNVALIDIPTNNCPTLASATRGNTTIENVYCRTSSGRTSGLISWLYDTGIKFKNVITEFPNANKDYPNLSGGVGALFSFDVNLAWTDNPNRNFDKSFSNVYAISKCNLAKFALKDANNVTTWEDYYLGENEEFIQGTAKKARTYVYKNVKKYDTMLEMKNANNDYSSFSSEFWDLSSGIPIFKGTKDFLMNVTMNGEVVDYTTIYTNTDENTCKIEITLNTLPIDKETVLQITEGMKFVTVDGNVLTAVADGKVKVKVTAKDNSFPEKVVTVYVRTEKGVEEEPTEEPIVDTEAGGGCGSISTGANSGMGGGLTALLFGGMITFCIIKARRKGKGANA